MTDDQVTTRDGRRLHVERCGEGSPTVVFESGMGVTRDAWALVAPTIAARTGVVVYDRSGIGRSPAGAGPRTLDHLVEDLGDLLDHVDDERCVLVGHSWGGPIVRQLTARRPERVAGLVLVDQADEGCPAYFTRATRLQHVLSFALLPGLARLGLLRRSSAPAVAGFPREVAVRFLDENTSVAAARGTAAEGRSYVEDLARLRDAHLPAPDVPVSIISGTKHGRFDRDRREAIVEAHARRAAAIPGCRHVRAERSGHLVMHTEPEVVIAEIERILDVVG